VADGLDKRQIFCKDYVTLSNERHIKTDEWQWNTTSEIHPFLQAGNGSGTGQMVSVLKVEDSFIFILVRLKWSGQLWFLGSNIAMVENLLPVGNNKTGVCQKYFRQT
jgi:hypothetical protein